MKLTIMLATVLVLGLLAVAPAQGQSMDDCPHEPTIAALHACVEHAVEHGHIDNTGIVRSLHAKLDAASAAALRGQPAVASNILEAFVQELHAQAGQHVEAAPAGHLQMHAEMVIAAIGG
jgi:hypothetical protein